MANSARFFWDLYDSTQIWDNYGIYTDNTSDSFHNLLNVWDDFSSGSADGGALEPAPNGKNVWDYYGYYSASLSEIYSNCLNSSSP